MKILSLVGARPQFIKEAILNRTFKKYGINEVLVNSGQHYDANMSDIFFRNLNMDTPKFNLGIGSGKHGEMTGRIIIAIEPVIESERPDLVLVYGDTNTTLAGALVTAKMKIPVAHVEAGIRMHPKTMPEEINRVLVDRISHHLFCPSRLSVENLKSEGITTGVHFVGDVMYDLFVEMKPHFTFTTFKQLSLEENDFILLTLHRDYNVDDPIVLKNILNSINSISKKQKIVFPIHPRTKKRVNEFGLNGLLDSLMVIEPIAYLDLMGLMTMSSKVITDSGGLQKESYFAGKQSVVLMPDTGWIELINSGCNVLSDGINLEQKLNELGSYKVKEGIYGNGSAGEKIVEIIRNTF